MFDDSRWGSDPRERDDDVRDRENLDPRDAFVNQLNLPRGHERELVRDRDREYTLRGSESRTLSLVGVFRVPRVTYGTTTAGRVTRAKAICGISASRGSFALCRCLVTAMVSSS